MPNYELAAERAARKYKIDPKIFKAMIRQESGFRMGVGSSAGARDIAQFMPATAKAYGVTLGDGKAADDLDGAARYLRDNLKRTGGNYHKALSIYNSGRPDAYKDPGFAKGQTYNYVRTIMAGAKGEHVQGGGGASARGGARLAALGGGTRTQTTTTETFDQEGFDKARRLSILGQHLEKRNPHSGLLRFGVLSAQAPDPAAFTSTSTQTKTTSLTDDITGRGYSDATAGLIQQLTERANKIDAQALPYKWGGGHGAKHAVPGSGVPLDCSGAVSSVLGIDPRVSGQMGSAPGAKPGKGKVNVYYNGEHTFMEVNGHFFGTSHENPGGGAGWIPRKFMDKKYLSRFKVVHFD